MTNNATYITDADGNQFFGAHGGAGCIVVSQKTGRMMLGLRSANVEQPGTWGTYGGAIEAGSNPLRTAMDELFEETGYDGPVRLLPLSVFTNASKTFSYHNHIAVVEDEFTPFETHENDRHQWFEFGNWPQPLHFGMDAILATPAAVKTLQDVITRCKRGEDFITGQPEPERTLYHCLYKQPQGEALLPLSDRNVNGRDGKFLFATPYISKALAFSFSYHDMQVAFNGSIEGTDNEFVVVYDRDRTLNAARDIRVFAFSSNNFERAWGAASRQYVSESAVAFKDASLAFQTQNLVDIMRQGLQIFSLPLPHSDTAQEAHVRKAVTTGGPEDMLHYLMEHAGLVWENQSRGYNVNETLEKRLTLLGQAQPQPRTDHTHPRPQ